MSLKKKFNFVFNVKIIFNYFYATFKQWKQEVESPYMYFSLIICIFLNGNLELVVVGNICFHWS